MKIQYSLTFDDMLRSHRSLLWKNQKNRYLVIAYSVFLIVFPVWAAPDTGNPFWMNMEIGLVIGLGLLYFTFFPKRRLKRRYASSKGILGEHTIELSEEGIREKTSYNDTFQSWESITDLKQDSRYLFILLGHEVHVIPKRDFASPKEAGAFFSKCKEMIKSN